MVKSVPCLVTFFISYWSIEQYASRCRESVIGLHRECFIRNKNPASQGHLQAPRCHAFAKDARGIQGTSGVLTASPDWPRASENGARLGCGRPDAPKWQHGVLNCQFAFRAPRASDAPKANSHGSWYLNAFQVAFDVPRLPIILFISAYAFRCLLHYL